MSPAIWNLCKRTLALPVSRVHSHGWVGEQDARVLVDGEDGRAAGRVAITWGFSFGEPAVRPSGSLALCLTSFWRTFHCVANALFLTVNALQLLFQSGSYVQRRAWSMLIPFTLRSDSGLRPDRKTSSQHRCALYAMPNKGCRGYEQQCVGTIEVQLCLRPSWPSRLEWSGSQVDHKAHKPELYEGHHDCDVPQTPTYPREDYPACSPPSIP
jgi:hypothetical protein